MHSRFCNAKKDIHSLLANISTFEHCIQPGFDVDSILLAILTVSPKRTNLWEKISSSQYLLRLQ